MLIASYDLRIKDTMSAYCQLQIHKQLFASICMQYNILCINLCNLCITHVCQHISIEVCASYLHFNKTLTK